MTQRQRRVPFVNTRIIDFKTAIQSVPVSFASYFSRLFFNVALSLFVQIRFISSPIKAKFVKSLMNIIDLLAILPYFVSIALNNSTDIGNLTEVRRIAQFFRIMRILRCRVF